MQNARQLMVELGVDITEYQGKELEATSPIDGETIAYLCVDPLEQVQKKIGGADRAFQKWRMVPAPRRGELVRLFAEELRKHKEPLGRLITLETGKILQEGLGEVQEMIDICDFAAGLSRQLYGLTIASERPQHRMMEAWHPLGVVGVISAFNFPAAVWSWNAALAFVCGNSVIWKPSEKAPLTAIAVHALFSRAMLQFGADAPEGLAQLILGGHEHGEALVCNPHIKLISATGSSRMGHAVAQGCAQRLARSILELGGNNAMIVTPSADLKMAVQAIVFSAVGTAGQRCTSLRRLFVHDSVYDLLVPHLKRIYNSLAIGNPLEQGTLVGPLIDKAAFDAMQQALGTAQEENGSVFGGQRIHVANCSAGYYVHPALVEMLTHSPIMHKETFAPILYVVRYEALQEAIAWNNAVPQGLASSIFTNDMREAELFLSAAGSDCGIANVNIGPSGAEIGGAFGGEKETGGGRESGSDAWKAYMRRATNTINYGYALPLAQGIQFQT
jgi:aldehyde dehydrogenase (NAD+)